ncbi:Uncharacterized protein SCF082_LOCUS28805 [Durusdinium trenchii]|uniref:Uncharacterized protein n=1 Tax=Durusdinium trenchii TaxID=1381693 RepID=A0ABP0MRQ7_9DINO
MEVIEITKEDLLKEDDQDLLEEEKEPLGHDPSERRDMEAQLREVLTPTPELLERVHRAEAAAARTFHTGQRQSLGELLAQNQHLAQMAGLSHWEDFPWRPKADEAGQDASLPARHVRRRRESAACANQVQDLYSGWADAASPHWRYQSSSPRYGGQKAPKCPRSSPSRANGVINGAKRPNGLLAARGHAPSNEPFTGGEEALPISLLEETRQAIAAAKTMADGSVAGAPLRGVGSVLRSALRLVAQSA